MSTYNPDKWVLIQMRDVQKVLAGWSGGYLDGDYWKLSSGVVDIKEDGDCWLFHNHSGSIYKCHKKARGTTSWSGAKYSEFKKLCEDNNVVFKDIEDIKLGEI